MELQWEPDVLLDTNTPLGVTPLLLSPPYRPIVSDSPVSLSITGRMVLSHCSPGKTPVAGTNVNHSQRDYADALLIS